MRLNKDSWLLTKPIAHRGLWGGDIKENSISAYKLASEKGYPIEIDLYLTTDGHLVSFHDDTLDRMTGESGFIYEKTLSELKELRLKGSDEPIPTFDEVLEIANGKSPLLIEIKNQPNKDIVKKVVERLKSYSGEFAIQSFNPMYIKQVKKLAPEFIRGILGTHDATRESFFTRKVLKNLSLNFTIKPDFISYNFNGLPLKKSKTKGKVVLAWTITSSEDELKVKDFCDNIIYEKFIPKNYQ